REPDDARAQDVREAKEQREPDALGLQVHRHLEEVQPAIRITGRVDGDVPLLVDAKVADPPAVDVVQLAGIVYRPAHRFGFSSTFVARACRRGARPRVRRRSHGPFRADALLLAGAEWYPISPAGERVPVDPHRRSASRARPVPGPGRPPRKEGAHRYSVPVGSFGPIRTVAGYTEAARMVRGDHRFTSLAPIRMRPPASRSGRGRRTG